MSYTYYNRRPDGQELEDCVCRAISMATSLKYNAVNNLLKLSANANKCDKLCICCYDKLLSDILCYTRHECVDYELVEDIVNEYKNNKVIIRISGHLTCGIYGKLMDIWDCSKKLADCYWIICEV